MQVNCRVKGMATLRMTVALTRNHEEHQTSSPENSISRQTNMQPGLFDSLVRHAALVLEVVFFVGMAGTAAVIVFAAYDIFTNVLKPDPPERREIDAIWRAA
jgi:hypothetical protein